LRRTQELVRVLPTDGAGAPSHYSHFNRERRSAPQRMKMFRIVFTDPASPTRGHVFDWRAGILTALLISFLFLPPARTPAQEPTDSTAGQLLVASAEMRDPRFVETVIYVVKHNSEGAFGLVINRPLAKGPIEDLLKGFRSEERRVGKECRFRGWTEHYTNRVRESRIVGVWKEKAAATTMQQCCR